MSLEHQIFVNIYIPSVISALLYGGYLVLFINSIYIMFHKKYQIKMKLQFYSTIVLFTISTLGFILGCVEASALAERSGSSVSQKSENLYYVSFVLVFALYTIANIIADIILIHRCYKIWGCNKRVIIFPMIISVLNNGLALVRVGSLSAEVKAIIAKDSQAISSIAMERMDILGVMTLKSFIAVNFFTNLFIPSMIAGRIWWIGHQASRILGTRQKKLTRYSMAICLESGIIYPLALLPALVVYLSDDIQARLYGDIIPVLIPVVGIAPTFIIVRVALGISVENVQSRGPVHIDNNISRGQGHTLISMWEENHDTERPTELHFVTEVTKV